LALNSVHERKLAFVRVRTRSKALGTTRMDDSNESAFLSLAGCAMIMIFDCVLRFRDALILPLEHRGPIYLIICTAYSALTQEESGKSAGEGGDGQLGGPMLGLAYWAGICFAVASQHQTRRGAGRRSAVTAARFRTVTRLA
jgi:hypothetical protein